VAAHVCIPLDARVLPTFFVIVPAEAVSLHEQRLKSSRRWPKIDVPPGLSDVLARHPAEIEVRIFDSGTQIDAWLAAHMDDHRGSHRLIAVQTDDLNTHPRTGLWMVMLTAMRIALELGGEVYDPDAMRTVDLQQLEGYLTIDGRIAVRDHITIPYSHGSTGRIWMTTKGMRKFGLPELEVRELPPESRWFWFILNGVAQRLVDLAFERVAADPDADVLRVSTAFNPDASLPFVGLSFTPGRLPNGLVRLLPPRPGISMERWVATIGDRLRVSTGQPSAN
jgi:hypothetical protein